MSDHDKLRDQIPTLSAEHTEMQITVFCIKDTSRFPEKPQRCHQLPFLFDFVTQACINIALNLLGFRCSVTEQEQGKAPEWPVSKIPCKQHL